jgi:hypothetical protein
MQIRSDQFLLPNKFDPHRRWWVAEILAFIIIFSSIIIVFGLIIFVLWSCADGVTTKRLCFEWPGKFRSLYFRTDGGVGVRVRSVSRGAATSPSGILSGSGITSMRSACGNH